MSIAEEARLEEAVEKALDAFWASVVESYPEITTGDLDAMTEGAMYADAACWIEKWGSLNSSNA